MSGTVKSTGKFKTPMLFTYSATITPSGGDVTDDIQLTGASDLIKFNDIVKQIIATDTVGTTTFNFGIFDKSDDFPLWTKSGVTGGYFNDAAAVLACINGEAYIRIDNASADIPIYVRLIYAGK